MDNNYNHFHQPVQTRKQKIKTKFTWITRSSSTNNTSKTTKNITTKSGDCQSLFTIAINSEAGWEVVEQCKHFSITSPFFFAVFVAYVALLFSWCCFFHNFLSPRARVVVLINCMVLTCQKCLFLYLLC